MNRITLPNISIIALIHESNNSVVYRGSRESDGEAVIIKLLKQEYPSPEQVTRYKQEYEIGHTLSINGVVKAYQLEKSRNRWLIIFEDFGGESLNKLSKSGGAIANLEAFLQIAIKICRALGEIHGQNIIHKDINPSNIVFNPETGELKIIDFGISTILSRETPTLKHPNILEGTLPYISPEQTGRTNRYLDYRTDFYSLGVTFYELLTEQLPFDTKDTMEMLHCHLAKKPLTPLEVNSDIPPIVSDLVMKLLDKNAEDRYQSAWGIKADLELCLHKLQTTATIEDFTLASQDLSERFQIPQKLYGRDAEIKSLLAAFIRISQNSNEIANVPHRSELMLVAGYCGIGKSVLVLEIYRPVTEAKGYFVSGKFDHFQRNIPYSAVIKAFQELIEQLLTEPTEKLHKWRDEIAKALGKNAQIIIDVIPEVELIIGKQSQVPELQPAEAQNRFKVTFENFIAVFTKPEHPLAIFLDDLQWADRASLNLLQLLMTASDRQNLLAIGAYRDNEISESHPLILTLKEIAKSGAAVETISLSPLALSDISALIADTLKTTPETVRDLAELVLEKTGGNPFFIKEFVKSLYTESLLEFDRQKNCWTWNLEQIKSRNITDNVVELMAGKIQNLPGETQEILQIAACIGSDFELETLAIVCEKTAKELALLLRSPVAEGLLLLLGDNYKLIELEVMPDKGALVEYKFAHDRIQQAAYSLIDESQRKATHLKIGRLLLANLSQAEIEDIIFDIVDSFNRGIELISDRQELDKLIQLNLIAAQKAKAATAYNAAVNYFNFALENLSRDSWQTNYNFTLNLYIETLEAEYLSLNYEALENLAGFILERANNVLDKARIYAIKILFYSAHNQMHNAINAGLEILGKLGVSLVETAPKTNLRIEELYDLPVMTDAKKEAAMRILMMLFGPIYTTNPPMLASLSFTMVHLSLEYGNCSLAAYAYGLYGLLLCGVLEDIEAGYKFGKLALRVLEKFAAKEIHCRVYNKFYSFIIHWKEAAIESLEPLRKETIPAGLETGEIEFACYASVNYVGNIACLGNHLEEARQHHLEYLELIGNLKQEFQLFYTQIWAQYVRNLLGLSASPTILSGEAFNETETLPILVENNNLSSLYCYYLVKAILCYLLKDSENAVANAKLAETYEGGIVGLFVATQNPFYYSLALLANLKNASASLQQEYLEKVAANQEKMAYWASHAPMNYQHKYDLVAAEKARILGENWQAAELYETAMTGAAKNGYLHEKALACELAAEFYLGRGMEEIGQTYIREARDRYFAWGAVVKVKDLETRYPSLFARHITAAFVSTSITSYSTQKGSSTPLDFNSFFKASQTLSGEIVLDTLLTKMMQIIIENAGAEKVYLILEKEGNWAIEATGTVDRIAVLTSIPLNTEGPSLLPLTVINYVARTKKSVVLADAAREGDFTRDEYVSANKPKSVLCTSLVQQGQLVGMLYLENNLASGVFTAERVESLQLLSSQAAIALTNALLHTQVRDEREFLDKVIATMQDGFAVVDTGGVKLRVNETFCQMTGFSKEELIGIKAPFPYWPPEELEAIQKVFAAILRGDMHSVELTLMRKNGERFPALVSPSVLSKEEGEPTYYFALVKDISDLKKAQQVLAAYNRNLEVEVTQRTKALLQAFETLKATQKQLVESEKMADLGSLVAGVAHEINTPIGTSISVASFLENQTVSFAAAIRGGELKRSVLNYYIETATESSQLILSNLQRAGELITSFKQVAVDRTSLEKRTFAVKPYIEEVLISLQPLVKKTTHILTVKGNDAIKTESYPGALSQIVTNLAINSLTHAYQPSESGQLCFEVTLEAKTLSIQYSDDGCGIEPENLKKIFDPFFTTARSKGGSGLGLHIVYNLVTQTLKGTIKCESKVGGGTQFIMNFPVQISEE